MTLCCGYDATRAASAAPTITIHSYHVLIYLTFSFLSLSDALSSFAMHELALGVASSLHPSHIKETQ